MAKIFIVIITLTKNLTSRNFAAIISVEFHNQIRGLNVQNQIRFYDLANGVRSYFRPSRDTRISKIVISSGALCDPQGKSGLAHLSEHVTSWRSRRHTPQRVDAIINRYMGGFGRRGSKMDLGVNRHSIFFGHEDLQVKDHQFILFDMLARFPVDRIIDCEGVKVEKAVLNQECRQETMDNFETLVENLVREAIYGKTPRGLTIHGNPEDIEKITTDDLLNFTEAHFVPDNMSVILIGPTEKEVIGLTRKYFRRMKSVGAPPKPKFPDPHHVLRSISRKNVVRDTKQYYMGLGFPTEGYLSEDAEAIDVLSEILSCRLYWKFRQRNKDFGSGVYDIPVEAERDFSGGLIRAQTATSSEEFLKKIVSESLKECRKLKREFVSKSRISAAKGNLEMIYVESMKGDSSELVMEAASNGDKDLVHLGGYRKRLRKVTQKRVCDVANKYLTTDAYARVVVGPKEINF